MKIKNISKKVVGNENFRLLPEDTMEVSGDELWVKSYLDRKKLLIVEGEPVAKAAVNVDVDAAAKEKAAAAKAEKELKKARNDILKKGDPGELQQLAGELGISVDNITPKELAELIKVAIK